MVKGVQADFPLETMSMEQFDEIQTNVQTVVQRIHFHILRKKQEGKNEFPYYR